MTLNELVQKRMFLLTVMLFVFIGYFGGISNIEINKTVGWAWNLTSWLYFIRVYFIPIFIIGYGILALLKYSTHRNLSFFHLILITLTLILDDIVSLTLNLIIILNLISFLTFLFNFIWSIRNRKSKLV